MAPDQGLPRSRRSRHRARPRPFSFVWREGHIIEENTGIELPSIGSASVGQPMRPGDPPNISYFDEEGRPATEETRRRLHNAMCEHLFVLDGRLRPLLGSPPSSSSPEEWNRYLHAQGLGMRSIHINGPSSYEGRRSPVRIPPADVRKFFAKRLAVLFDRDPEDLLVKRLSEFLSREWDWHLWWQEPSLQPFRDELARNRWKISYLQRLESVSFMRSGAPWLITRKREPFRAEFESSSATYIFAFPEWPKAAFLRAKEARRMVLAVAFAYRCRPGMKEMAALVWKAGKYLDKPDALRHRKHTLETVSTHFGLTPRQVRYAAQKLPKRIPPLQSNPP
jgi:hypothetical protein